MTGCFFARRRKKKDRNRSLEARWRIDPLIHWHANVSPTSCLFQPASLQRIPLLFLFFPYSPFCGPGFIFLLLALFKHSPRLDSPPPVPPILPHFSLLPPFSSTQNLLILFVSSRFHVVFILLLLFPRRISFRKASLYPPSIPVSSILEFSFLRLFITADFLSLFISPRQDFPPRIKRRKEFSLEKINSLLRAFPDLCLLLENRGRRGNFEEPPF